MPRWGDLIELVSVETNENDYGDSVEQETFKKVFANKKSIRQSEFYQAMTTDLKPELMFEVREVEYSGEERLRYPANENGRMYYIRRTHSKKGETLELIAEGVANDG